MVRQGGVFYLGIFPGFVAFLVLGNMISFYKASNTAGLLFLIPPHFLSIEVLRWRIVFL
jgi:hypothetical protein